MKKILLGLVVLFVMAGTAIAQEAGGGLNVISDDPPADTTVATAAADFDRVTDNIFRQYSCLWVDLWVKTRSTTDSLLVVMQTTGSIVDTGGVNLTNFGGVKTATGHYSFAKCNDYWIGADSVKFFGRYFRFITQHGASAGESLPGDTSRFVIQYFESGTKLKEARD